MHQKVDYRSPNTTYTFDLNQNTIFKRDPQNLINEVSIDQLNTLENTSLLDIHLSKGKIVEPHYHQDAAELVYCIAGGVTVSMINPFTQKLHSYPITPGQVVNVPQGWWHYIVSDTDHAQFLGIFDAPKPNVILGSDILNLTPSKIIADTYCVDEEEWEEVTAPIPPSVFIGPPKDCQRDMNHQPTIPQPREEQWNPYSYCTPFK